MRYAFDENDKRIEVSFSGQRAICPDCHSEVIGRFGQYRPPHWYHKSKNECDTWYEPITDWHLNWQNEFPEKNREVTMWDASNATKHRADIRLDNGIVIEFQHSSIKPEEILQRETFYRQPGMIWILDGNNLAQKSSIRYKYIPKQFSLDLVVPFYLDEVNKYDMDDFRDKIIELEEYKKLSDSADLIRFETNNGNSLEFTFLNTKPFSQIQQKLKDEIYKLAINIYGYDKGLQVWAEVEVRYVNNLVDRYEGVDLNKKFWRIFIEEMVSPVFFDKLPGLESHLLYWYQKNRIVPKNEFLKKYLKFT